MRRLPTTPIYLFAITAYAITVALVLAGPGTAHAALIDKGEYILDDNSGLLWSRNDIQLDYTLTSALDRIDALNLYDAVLDVDNDGYLDNLVWSLASRTDVEGIYTSYSLDDRNTAFGAGNRSYRYTPELRYTASWTQLLSGWATDVFFGSFLTNSTPGWGNHSGACFIVTIPGLGCSGSGQDDFDPGWRGPPERGLWASATITYGNGTIPVPGTLLLFGTGILGLAGLRCLGRRQPV